MRRIDVRVLDGFPGEAGYETGSEDGSGSGGEMDSYSIKSVTFGGFDKLDVVRYIDSLTRNAAGEKQGLADENRELREENRRLREQFSALEETVEELRRELAAVTGERDHLRQEAEEVAALREELEPLRIHTEELERLRAETESLRHDAAAYARFRQQIGTIECEARERASGIEAAAAEKARQTAAAFYERYQDLMRVFESTATHVTGELRKVEVNLTELPRVMDQADTELKAMADQISEPVLKNERNQVKE